MVTMKLLTRMLSTMDDDNNKAKTIPHVDNDGLSNYLNVYDWKKWVAINNDRVHQDYLHKSPPPPKMRPTKKKKSKKKTFFPQEVSSRIAGQVPRNYDYETTVQNR